MMTVLNIEQVQNKSILDTIRSVFRPYSIETELKENDDASVLSITYRQKRGEIKFNKIYEHCIGRRKTILCDKKINLFNTHFRRFNSLTLKKRLMENYICSILDSADFPPSELSISYYDPKAESPSLAEKLLKYTSRLTVVSDMPRFYENEAERLAKKCGASVIVSNSPDKLIPCNILIAPTVIKESLPTVSSSLIFTIHRPPVPISGNVITDYQAELPEKYASLKSDFIDDIYFMSGLYSLCSAYELGEIIPTGCGNQFDEFTNENIIHQIKINIINK